MTDPVAARLSLGLGGSLLEDLLDVGPGGVGSTGHEGGTVSGTLLTTRDTGADEEETLGLELVGSSDRVGVVRVTTVNDNVTLLEVRLELADEVVDGLAGLDEEDDSPGSLELGAELLDRVGTDNVGSCEGKGENQEGMQGRREKEISAGHETWMCRNIPLASFSRKWSTLEVVLAVSDVSLGHRGSAEYDVPVVSDDLESLVVHVKDQVLTLYVAKQGIGQE